jgi:hypothetical protein
MMNNSGIMGLQPPPPQQRGGPTHHTSDINKCLDICLNNGNPFPLDLEGPPPHHMAPPTIFARPLDPTWIYHPSSSYAMNGLNGRGPPHLGPPHGHPGQNFTPDTSSAQHPGQPPQHQQHHPNHQAWSSSSSTHHPNATATHTRTSAAATPTTRIEWIFRQRHLPPPLQFIL